MFRKIFRVMRSALADNSSIQAAKHIEQAKSLEQRFNEQERLHKLLSVPLGVISGGVYVRAPGRAPDLSNPISRKGYGAGRPWARKGLSRAQRRAVIRTV